jgi:diguanylate cyclase (GGDEF)-like protein
VEKNAAVCTSGADALPLRAFDHHHIGTPLDKILIVDDDPGMIRSLGHILADYPGRSFATSGADALQQALADPPDLILLDAQMPGMDGFELCRVLKRDPRFEQVPLIFITKDDGEQTEARVFDLGAVDFIAKPVSATVLRARVATQLRLRRMTAELQRLACTDTLTGLANRRVFDERLAGECRRARRSDLPLVLAMVDVDHFKAYNDCYGHPAGDACLREVAAALRECTQRPDDLAARYGGEEFALLLPDTDAQGAAAVAAKLQRGLVQRALPHAGSAVAAHVTVSIGVATLAPGPAGRSEPDDATLLLAHADRALYAAKAAGRARVWLAASGGQDPQPLAAALPP